MRHLLVLGDSLAFHGPVRAEPPQHPDLFPSVCAAALGPDVRVDLVARRGWTARDGWWSLTKDPVVWGTYLPRASAVVLAQGGFDQLPAALPTWLRDSMPYVRPGPLRRRVREMYHRASPTVIRLSDGRLQQLPPRATSHYHGRILSGIRTLRPDLPFARLLPSPWHSRLYPVQRSHAPAVAEARRWCETHGVPAVDTDALVDTRTNNPDGLHWGWDSHARVGTATAAALRTAGWGSA
ncbi:MAG: SGNH/GDSL hydrolase family protein [Candidatus Nanopelagicales bacterium]